jgi:hypothetical protein
LLSAALLVLLLIATGCGGDRTDTIMLKIVDGQTGQPLSGATADIESAYANLTGPMKYAHQDALKTGPDGKMTITIRPDWSTNGGLIRHSECEDAEIQFGTLMEGKTTSDVTIRIFGQNDPIIVHREQGKEIDVPMHRTPAGTISDRTKSVVIRVVDARTGAPVPGAFANLSSDKYYLGATRPTYPGLEHSENPHTQPTDEQGYTRVTIHSDWARNVAEIITEDSAMYHYAWLMWDRHGHVFLESPDGVGPYTQIPDSTLDGPIFVPMYKRSDVYTPTRPYDAWNAWPAQ